MSRDDDEICQQPQYQCGRASVSRQPESGYITPSDHELVIDSIFAPCHDRLGGAFNPPDHDSRLVSADSDDVNVNCTTTSSTLDEVVSPSLAAYLACVVPPPPSVTDELVESELAAVDVMDLDPTSLIVPPPPTPSHADAVASSNGSSTGSSKLLPRSNDPVSQWHASPSTSSPSHASLRSSDPSSHWHASPSTLPRSHADASPNSPSPGSNKLPPRSNDPASHYHASPNTSGACVKLPPPTMPKQTKKSSDLAMTKASSSLSTANKSSAHSHAVSRGRDVMSRGDDVSGPERLVNGAVAGCMMDTVEFFPPPPPLDDLDLPAPARDNLPPPPPSVLQQRADTAAAHHSVTSPTRQRVTTDRRRLENIITSPSSSDAVSDELAAAMITARLRAESTPTSPPGLLSLIYANRLPVGGGCVYVLQMFFLHFLFFLFF